MDAQWIQTLATIGSFLVLGTVYIVNGRNAAKILAERLKGIDQTMGDFKDELKKMQDVIVAQALQSGRIQLLDERTLAHGKRVDELAKGMNKVMFKLAIKEED
jgi:hypothetical protein